MSEAKQETGRGSVDQTMFSMYDPFPPEIVADFPDHLRPHAEAGRLLMIEADRQHYTEHHHPLFDNGACLLSWVGKEVKRESGPEALRTPESMADWWASIYIAVRLSIAHCLGTTRRRASRDPVTDLLRSLFPNAEVVVKEEEEGGPTPEKKVAGFQSPKMGQA